jgi:threonyl-tRNA synthetase
MAQIKVTLPDGSIKEVAKGISAGEIVKSISEGLYRNALAVKINDEVSDLNVAVNDDCNFKVLTFSDAEGKQVYWHTASHILAQAVKRIYPTAKLAIGPSIKTGFYYDIEFKTNVTQDDFAKIESEMQKIIKADFSIERKEMSKKEAKKYFEKADEDYKVELVEDIPDDKVSFYTQGEFTDLCRGPHLPSTGKVKAFKLTQLAGAYWRGNENNKMLTRIYGTAFDKKKDLDEYLAKVEEAKKRDHNKIGRELGYFMTDENIGQGLPLLMPKGTQLFETLTRFVEDEEKRRGYVRTKTPYMAKSNLYKISGHWDHYLDGMFVIGDEMKDKEVFALRPMTCPFQYTIYNNGLKSYRDLPIRYGETSTLFRNESSGEMHGLIRIRQFTLSEGHIICTPEQLESEFVGVLDLIKYIMNSVGLYNDLTFRFSRWDPNNKEKYIYEPEVWEKAEAKMKQILDHIGLDYVEAIDEAAFYGPKLDIQIANVYGKEDTLITIQIDMFLSKNFDMTYIDENGEKQYPYIIHRSSMGCYERTMALLLEKYAGAMPFWLAPVQVKVLSITDRAAEKANEIKDYLEDRGVRTEVDNRNEKIGYKIREAQLEKIPYMFILGDKEVENNVVSVRHRKDGDLGCKTVEEIVSIMLEEVRLKKCD